MDLVAKNVMTNPVVAVSPETSLADAHRLFVEEGIHGAPVLEDDGSIAGVVSSSDLLRAVHDERDTVSTEGDYLRDLLEFSAPDWAGDPNDFQDRLGQRTVAEVMTPGAVTVAPEAPISEVARTLREYKIHRVWVEEEGKLRGVISTFDLMPILEELSE
ncbi:MAG: CBS domain-containing protein [Deltaproteobacteria bacterium]|nr:CBS domain-containing protein [Deltaproteobacteria bacterium]